MQDRYRNNNQKLQFRYEVNFVSLQKRLFSTTFLGDFNSFVFCLTDFSVDLLTTTGLLTS